MKKIILIISLILSGPLLKAQNSIDSCLFESSDSTILQNSNNTSFKNACNFDDTCLHITAKDLTLTLKKENKMKTKKEKFFTTKRVVILTSLVALQVAFGFDPKFTAINLIWLLF